MTYPVVRLSKTTWKPLLWSSWAKSYSTLPKVPYPTNVRRPPPSSITTTTPQIHLTPCYPPNRSPRLWKRHLRATLLGRILLAYVNSPLIYAGTRTTASSFSQCSSIIHSPRPELIPTSPILLDTIAFGHPYLSQGYGHCASLVCHHHGCL